MSQSRRLAAILAADVAGYSRLLGEDEVDTFDRPRPRAIADGPIAAAGGAGSAEWPPSR